MTTAVAPQERMFFLLGRGRSGTTLLKNMLDTHPAISIAPEGLFMMNLYGSYERGEWTEQRIQRFSRHAFFERRMRRWRVNRAELEARWLAMKSEPTFAGLSAEVYEAHADATGKQPGRSLGDKNPRYSLCAEELRTIFPRAKFVHMVRDYRDNVLSFLNVPFDLKSPAALAHRWSLYNQAILDASKRAPEAFHLLRFEDLVAAPEATLGALCRFLGVEMDLGMLNSYEARGDYGVAWHQHVSRPIDPELAGQWRRSLTPRQAATLDRICQPLAGQFGYQPAEPVAARGSRLSAGAAIGWGVTMFERQVFRLPIAVQTLLNNIYRRLTGNIIR